MKADANRDVEGGQADDKQQQQQHDSRESTTSFYLPPMEMESSSFDEKDEYQSLQSFDDDDDENASNSHANESPVIRQDDLLYATDEENCFDIISENGDQKQLSGVGPHEIVASEFEDINDDDDSSLSGTQRPRRNSNLVTTTTHHRRTSLLINNASSHHARRVQNENSDNNHLKRQTRTISVIRCLVITMLLTVAAVVANITYIVSLRAEEQFLEREFHQYGQGLKSGFQDHLLKLLQVADSFVSSAVLQDGSTAASARRTLKKNHVINQTDNIETAQLPQYIEPWPFVTLADFDMLANGVRDLASISTISFLPLVYPNDRVGWEAYANQQWNAISTTTTTADADTNVIYRQASSSDINIPQTGMFRVIENGALVDDDDDSETPASPIFQVAPSTSNNKLTLLYNMASETRQLQALQQIVMASRPSIPQIWYAGTETSLYQQYKLPTVPIYYPITRSKDQLENTEYQQQSNSNDDDDDVVVGTMLFEVGLEKFFEDVLYQGHTPHRTTSPVLVVVESTCQFETTVSSKSFTYQVVGPSVEFLGSGDLSVVVRDAVTFQVSSTFEEWNDILEQHVNQYKSNAEDSNSAPMCSMKMTVHPTAEFREAYLTLRPIKLLFGIAGLFLFAAGVFVVYDCMLERRQKGILAEATQANLLLHAHYPKQVRDRLLANAEAKMMEQSSSNKRRLKGFLQKQQQEHRTIVGGQSKSAINIMSSPTTNSEPIADLFQNCSIMFGDISGFSAWSSEREPSQVFLLLETLYGGIDQIARRFGVFKVETVGDSYVAATGLPDARIDHPVALARFAHHALMRVAELVDILETRLGPGTRDLQMRVGINSGPITAGVLRGDKTRFQLFGDTMNVASRMETTGKPGHIQLSKDTATLLEEQGKGHWLVKRADAVAVKGKGEMETYWLHTANQHNPGIESMVAANKRRRQKSTTGGLDDTTSSRGKDCSALENPAVRNDLNERYIQWNVETLVGMLREVVAHRDMLASEVQSKRASVSNATRTVASMDSTVSSGKTNKSGIKRPVATRRRSSVAGSGGNNSSNMRAWAAAPGSTVIDEIKDVVPLPAFEEIMGSTAIRKFRRDINPTIRSELHDYISQLAQTYRPNPFHNLEHASHVVLSATKLLKRIVRPDDYEGDKPSDLHDFTYGISSDPLTRFAVVFSALIHDAGHTGVPNGQLAKEEPAAAAKYSSKSLAEQQSVDIAWQLLMSPSFENLRNCIFSTDAERSQFRQLVVNCVLATDIFDKDLSTRRKARWTKVFGEDRSHLDELLAFHESSISNENSAESNLPSKNDVLNLKATIVLEHVIQASDVAHTMQHWHIYCRWNERLFREMYQAYKDGRGDKDPSIGWYRGELWFFDNYVIPLAKKLKDCGVFGVSSDEYLNYALENRSEFATKGENIVQAMLEAVQGNGSPRTVDISDAA